MIEACILGSLASLLGQGQSTVPPTTTTTVPDPNIDYSGDTLIDEDTGSSEEFDNLKAHQNSMIGHNSKNK